MTLADLLAREKRLRLPAALEILVHAGIQVAARHDRGEVLGRLTPAEVILQADGSVGLIPCATVQDASGAADSRVDVLCLGELFRLMLTGRADGHPGRLPGPLRGFYQSLTSPDPDARLQTAALVVRRGRELQVAADALAAEWAALNEPVRRRVGVRLRAFVGRQWAALCLGFVLAVVLQSGAHPSAAARSRASGSAFPTPLSSEPRPSPVRS